MLSVDSVSFRYRRNSEWVLHELNWSCPTGVNFLLGPNGAGKSTLINLLASVAFPQAGTFQLAELVMPRRGAGLQDWRRQVGWVPQQVDLVPGMTSVEQVAYAAWLKGVPRTEARQRAVHALELVGLGAKVNERVTTLSGGQARRLGIASALVHDAGFILMDEPTAGLDPNQRARLYRVIQENPDVAWLISTHQTEDLEMRASSISVMDAGQMAWQGATADFLALGHGASDEQRALSSYRSLIGEEE